jgi:hypothetical protein
MNMLFVACVASQISFTVSDGNPRDVSPRREHELNSDPESVVSLNTPGPSPAVDVKVASRPL